MYISKRFLIILIVIAVWLLVVILPLIYLRNLMVFYASPPEFYTITNGIIFLSPLAWLLLYYTISRILPRQSVDTDRLARLEQLLQSLTDADLERLTQRPGQKRVEMPDAEPDETQYDALHTWVTPEKLKNQSKGK